MFFHILFFVLYTNISYRIIPILLGSSAMTPLVYKIRFDSLGHHEKLNYRYTALRWFPKNSCKFFTTTSSPGIIYIYKIANVTVTKEFFAFVEGDFFTAPITHATTRSPNFEMKIYSQMTK